MVVAGRVLASAAHLSLGEFFSLYPPKLYFVAWVPRVLFQLAFFSLLAGFLGGPDYLAFVVIGTVAHATYIGALGFTVASITWEQGAGTIPLLVAAPTTPLLVLVGRNLAMLGNGIVSGLIILPLAVAVLGLELSFGQLLAAALILVVITGSVYTFGLLLGGFVLRFAEYRNVASSLATIALTFLSGVYVPVTALPTWIQPLSEILPVTHGLRALRQVTLGTSDANLVALQLSAEILVGVAYFVVSQVSFAYFLRRARTAGTLDFH